MTGLGVQIITFDDPSSVGGTEGRARAYVRELQKRGMDVSLYALNQPATEGPSQGHSGASRSRSMVRVFRGVASGRGRPVFFLTGGITLFGVVILAYCRMSRVRSMIFLYGKDILSARGGLVERTLYSAAIRLAGLIGTNSNFTSRLLPTGQRRKVTVLYPGVDPSIARNGQAPTESQEDVILFVGRLVKRKGVDDLLAAMSSLKSRYPSIKLDVVGDGPEREGLEKMASRMGLGGAVRFRGELKGEPLYNEFSSCAVFAMPSKSAPDDVEGFGTVFLEAALFAKPSVGTISGGIPEAVSDMTTGLLVPEGDILALSSAISRLLEEPELRRKLGENAKIRVLSNFTWAHAADALVSSSLFQSRQAR